MRFAIAEIRERVAQVRTALLSPGVDAILGCIPVLEEAAERLRSLNEEAAERLRSIDIDTLPPEERAEVSLLKYELQRVQSLVASGLSLQQGWARHLAWESGTVAVSAGYTASGSVAGRTRAVSDDGAETRLRVEVQG